MHKMVVESWPPLHAVRKNLLHAALASDGVFSPTLTSTCRG